MSMLPKVKIYIHTSSFDEVCRCSASSALLLLSEMSARQRITRTRRMYLYVRTCDITVYFWGTDSSMYVPRLYPAPDAANGKW